MSQDSWVLDMKAHHRIQKLEKLVNHMRYCRQCGYSDVRNCQEGNKLYTDAMPAPIYNPS